MTTARAVSPDRFLDADDVFLAFANAKRPDPHSTFCSVQDVDIRRLLSRFSIRIRSNAELRRIVVEKCSLCASHVHQSLVENREFCVLVLVRL